MIHDKAIFICIESSAIEKYLVLHYETSSKVPSDVDGVLLLSVGSVVEDELHGMRAFFNTEKIVTGP